jgi:hypothetical protein
MRALNHKTIAISIRSYSPVRAVIIWALSFPRLTMDLPSLQLHIARPRLQLILRATHGIQNKAHTSQ